MRLTVASMLLLLVSSASMGRASSSASRRGPSAPAPRWATLNNTNAVPGSASQPPTSYVIGGVATAGECESRCQSNATCDIYAWSPNSHHCYFRLDHTWKPGWPNAGYVSGCVASGKGAVWGCDVDPATAPCPSHSSPPTTQWPAAPTGECPWQVSGSVGEQIGETAEGFRMLGVNFDFWPSTKANWGTCGVLTSGLADPLLLELTSRLNGSLLRIGGSPADFMVYDVFEGACSSANLNKTQPAPAADGKDHGYFCPIWDQVPGQCLTMERWGEINAFAVTSGLHIAFDLNACWGRSGPDAEMDFTLIGGLFNHTAQMAAQGKSAVWAFQFGNEVYSEISPTRYGGDMLAMKAMLAQAWARLAPAQQVPKLMGPDNGADDMSAEHLDGILSAGGAEAMVAATYHDYWDSCIDHQNASTLAAAGLALNVTCLDARMAATVSKFAPTTDKHQVGLWLTEGALHASSGVDGLTNVFVSSLFYAHALGQLARTGVGLFSRQTLLGGDYELINRTTGAPNPDYYIALLWHDLVGKEVLNVTMEPLCSDPAAACAHELRVHAHTAAAAAGGSESESGGGTTVVLINFSEKSAYSVNLGDKLQSGTMWQLRGQPRSNQIFLNDEPLAYHYPTAASAQQQQQQQQQQAGGKGPGLPPMPGKEVAALELPPVSVTFVQYPPPSARV